MSNKKKQAAKRRQKKRERQKAKRPARVARRTAESKARGKKLAHRLKQVGEARKLLEDGQQVPDITDDEYVFWLCHGANYMASDEKNGVWDPIFDIYEGEPLPDPEGIPQAILPRYRSDFESEYPLQGSGAAVLAWTVTDKQTIRIYRHEAMRRLLEKDPECDAEAVARKPHNPTVWGMMAQIKARAQALGETDGAE